MATPLSPTTFLASLQSVASAQQQIGLRNRGDAPETFNLIEQGMTLASQVTLLLNEDPILARRKALPASDSTPETIRMNLLSAACSSLVNAALLAMYGAHVDALTITRSSLEAIAYAEYFRDNPVAAIEWDRTCSDFRNLYDARRSSQRFENKHHVMRTVEAKYDPDPSMKLMFVELSAYGTHSTPATVNLRLSSKVPNTANLGFMSTGKLEANRLAAGRVVHIVAYALSEFREGFAGYLVSRPDWVRAHDRFLEALDRHRHDEPHELSYAR